MVTGLAYEESDLDLAICGLEVLSRNELTDNIQGLSKLLSNLPFVLSCQAIVTAKVPVLKLVNKEIINL